MVKTRSNNPAKEVSAKPAAKTAAERRSQKAASKKKRSFDEAETAANETTQQSEENAEQPAQMIRHKKPTVEERKADKARQREQKQKRDGELVEKYDKNLHDSDDSSDEEVLIRTGNVPQEWYDLYEHQGYSVKGQPVKKLMEKDELEKFLERQNDKTWWAKIFDQLNNKEVKLSKADLDLIQRVRAGKFADASIDPYADFDVQFENKNDIHPFSGGMHEPKSRFVQSRWERLKITKFV